ncbi:MAG: hypothetical protein HY268_27140, partial [Deltaproteobacteria bacterium]|nr:hypothetical protein [Deltaproteobacteria bacterium]
MQTLSTVWIAGWSNPYERSMNLMKMPLPLAWWHAGSVLVRSALLLLLAALSAGCSLLKWPGELPSRTFKTVITGMEGGTSVDPVDLQEQVQRAADIFLIGVTTSVEQLRRDGAPISQVDLQTVKISYTTTILALATGPNALANLLDMVVLITRSRLMVETYWLPEVYGESARPFLETCREAETQLWQLAASFLTAAQQEELRQTIQTMHQQDRNSPALLPLQALNFVTEVAKVSQKKRSEPSSVFSLLMLDPLSGLDPATRELAETRLFAERALFIAQRMPNLLRWEMELFTVKTAELPQLQQLLTNSTQLAAAADRFSQVAVQLPTWLSTERESLLGALKEQETGLSSLTREVQQTLATGSQMADSTNLTLKTFQEVMARLNSGPQDPSAEPFRIREYTDAAAQIHATALELVTLLQALDGLASSPHLAQVSSQFSVLTQQAQTSGRAVVDYAFYRALLLVLLGCGAVLTTALAYRVL